MALALFSDDTEAREAALLAAAAAPDHERSALAVKLAAIAKEEATYLSSAEDAGGVASRPSIRLVHACRALSILRVDAAKSCLLRLCDEGTPSVKRALAEALRETRSAEGRAVLIYLLSDDDARAEAIRAIDAAPWPSVLPALIEVAEADDAAAILSANAIAKCGAAGWHERNAAADFLLEALDDDAIMASAANALLHLGLSFPGIPEKAKRIAKEPGKRKAIGLCLLAASTDEGNASLLELALSGGKPDVVVARKFLEPLRQDPDERIRHAAERAWKALDLG